MGLNGEQKTPFEHLCNRGNSQFCFKNKVKVCEGQRAPFWGCFQVYFNLEPAANKVTAVTPTSPKRMTYDCIQMDAGSCSQRIRVYRVKFGFSSTFGKRQWNVTLAM